MVRVCSRTLSKKFTPASKHWPISPLACRNAGHDRSRWRWAVASEESAVKAGVPRQQGCIYSPWQHPAGCGMSPMTRNSESKPMRQHAVFNQPSCARARRVVQRSSSHRVRAGRRCTEVTSETCSTIHCTRFALIMRVSSLHAEFMTLTLHLEPCGPQPTVLHLRHVVFYAGNLTSCKARN